MWFPFLNTDKKTSSRTASTYSSSLYFSLLQTYPLKNSFRKQDDSVKIALWDSFRVSIVTSCCRLRFKFVNKSMLIIFIYTVPDFLTETRKGPVLIVRHSQTMQWAIKLKLLAQEWWFDWKEFHSQSKNFSVVSWSRLMFFPLLLNFWFMI